MFRFLLVLGLALAGVAPVPAAARLNVVFDVAAAHPELILQAEALLRREVSANPLFPVPLPGVADPAADSRKSKEG